jgi:predicted nuclease of restriction endonuclease-like (RecB) superfamily
MAKPKKSGKQLVPATRRQSMAPLPGQLLDDLRNLIWQAREATAQAVNSALVLLYWEVGRRIRQDILKEKRAGYGEQIVPTLSAQLVADFGDGFLGLADTYSEKDLETAIVREIQQFILELGSGFAFIDRQKRLIIDGKDYYIDLLLYHRRLR